MPFFRVGVHRNASAVVANAHRTIVMDDHIDPVAIPRQGLVDGVIHHLEHHVVQAGAVIGVADIHARTLTDGIQAFQNLDVA